MGRHMPRMALLFACASLEIGAAAAELTPYFESSANQNPKSNAGLSLDADRLKLKADVALRAPAHETTIVPRLTSELELGSRIGLETRVDFGDRNAGAELPDTKFDTTLRFQSPVPFLDELEGTFWRSPSGETGRILDFGFYQKFAGTDAAHAVTIRSRATLEATTTPAAFDVSSPFGSDSRRLGLETEIAGLMAGHRPRRRTALRLKVEKVQGPQPETASTVTYDRAWPLGWAQVGFDVQMQKATYSTANEIEPSLGFRWRAQF